MVADAVAWVCRSPRRLAAFAVGLMAVVLIGSNLLGAGASASNQPRTQASGPAVTAAQVPSVQQWQAALEPLSTKELATALRTTDPAALPGSAPEGDPVVRYVAQNSALIAVPLANGSSVLVTVVSDASGQRVSDIQPFAGDS